MRNILIMGSGRSGTSAIAGCLNNSGFFTGDNYIAFRKGNPKGFFEDSQVNSINEEILFKSYPKKFPFSGEWINDGLDKKGTRWLSRIPLNVKLNSSKEIEDSIRKLVSIKNFCYKDPRFSYTLPIWRPFLGNTAFICIFRDPFSTVKSILVECLREDYLKEIRMNFESALEIWKLIYSHILRVHSKKGKWFFIHYNQLFSQSKIKELGKFVGADINSSFFDKRLKKPSLDVTFPKDISEIYSELCYLAKHNQR